MPGLDASKAKAILPHLNAAMARGEVTTLRRAQYFLAHVGHESASLRYFEEIASGAAYEGRTDLGNIHPGDGPRFKGRGPIQLTGRRNYTNFSHWLGQGDLLVHKPALVARYDYALLAAVFYWSTRQLNAYCDRGDFLGMVHTPGGGHMGTDDRVERLRAVERLGDAVLPMGKGSYSSLTGAERSAVRRLSALRARANRPHEEGGGWGSPTDPGSRRSRGERTSALIRVVLRRRISVAAAATGWERADRRERHCFLGTYTLGLAPPAIAATPESAQHPEKR